ncbi:MAG: DUF6340 family protein [Myxococcota bacterium]
MRQLASRYGLLAVLSCVLQGCITLTEDYAVQVDMPARQVERPIDSIAVLDFASNVPGWGPGASQSIRGGLTREGYIRVVDRGSYVLIGDVSVGRPETSVEHSSHRVEYEENDVKRVKTVHVYTFRKKLTSALSYQLRAGAETVAANTFTMHYDESFARDSAAAARAAAPSDANIIGMQLGAMANLVVFDVSPHSEQRTLKFEIGSHAGFRQGMAYLKNGRQDQALDLWQQVADQATEPKEKASALYNIAIVLELRQEYASAFDLLGEADFLVPGNDRYIQAMTRVEKAKLDQEALARQTRR